MPEYTVAAVVAAVAVVAYELVRARTGVFGDRRDQATMASCFGFMLLVNGWLTKLSAPIVLYDADAKTPWRIPWDIPVEDYLFGFALLTLVIVRWKQAAYRDERRARVVAVTRDGTIGRGVAGEGT